MKYVEGHYQQVEGNGKEQTLELPDVAPDRIVGIHAWPTPKGASKTWTNNQPSWVRFPSALSPDL